MQFNGRREANEAAREAQRDASRDTRTARAGDRKHPLFEGKDNFDVEGKISRVSKDRITVQREGLPAATLMVSKDTKVELDGERTSMARLRQGQDVKASFNLQGDKPMAVEIQVDDLDKDDRREMQEQRRDTERELQERRQEAQQQR